MKAEEIESLTDKDLINMYDNLDSKVTNHPVIKELQKRGLLKGKHTPTDGKFKSIEKL